MKKIIAFVLVAALMLTFTSTALAASWDGSGTFYTSESIAKPDTTSTGRYVWTTPITVKVTTMGASVTVKPVNADDESMGSSVTIPTTKLNKPISVALSNQNYMHIHLKVTTSAYSVGNWSGTYTFQAN
jgi:hypothetical protein